MGNAEYMGDIDLDGRSIPSNISLSANSKKSKSKQKKKKQTAQKQTAQERNEDDRIPVRGLKQRVDDTMSTQSFSPSDTRRQRLNERSRRRVGHQQQLELELELELRQKDINEINGRGLDFMDTDDGNDNPPPPVGDGGPGFRLLFLKYVWEGCEKKKRDLNINHNPALKAEVYKYLKKLPDDIEDTDMISNIRTTQVEFNHVEHLISDLEREYNRVAQYKLNIHERRI